MVVWTRVSCVNGRRQGQMATHVRTHACTHYALKSKFDCSPAGCCPHTQLERELRPLSLEGVGLAGVRRTLTGRGTQRCAQSVAAVVVAVAVPFRPGLRLLRLPAPLLLLQQVQKRVPIHGASRIAALFKSLLDVVGPIPADCQPLNTR